jgi:hypothetical protein
MASAAPTASKMTLTASAQSGAESCRWRAASRAISSVRVMAAFYAELLWARSRTPQTATPGADPERWPRDSICSICGRLVIGESLGKNRGAGTLTVGVGSDRRRSFPMFLATHVSFSRCQWPHPAAVLCRDWVGSGHTAAAGQRLLPVSMYRGELCIVGECSTVVSPVLPALQRRWSRMN